MSNFSTRKLLLLLAVLIASTAVVAAQSGRRGKAKSTAPPPPAAPTPTEVQTKPQTSPQLQLLVAIHDPTGFDQVAYYIPDIVIVTCVDRLAQAKQVMPTPALARMTRGEAIKAAKAETVRYVVWLQVVNERAEYGAEVSSHSGNFYVNFIIYEPVTAKIKKSGRADYQGARVGNVGVSVPSSRQQVYSDYAIKEAAKRAADQILSAFEINIGGWPR